MSDDTKTHCLDHSGLSEQIRAMREDVRRMRATLRWLVGAVLALALVVGGPELVARIGGGVALADADVPSVSP